MHPNTAQSVLGPMQDDSDQPIWSLQDPSGIQTVTCPIQTPVKPGLRPKFGHVTPLFVICLIPKYKGNQAVSIFIVRAEVSDASEISHLVHLKDISQHKYLCRHLAGSLLTGTPLLFSMRNHTSRRRKRRRKSKIRLQK